MTWYPAWIWTITSVFCLQASWRHLIFSSLFKNVITCFPKCLVCLHAQLLSHVRLFGTPETSPPGSSGHGISWAEYWSGLPFPTPVLYSRSLLIIYFIYSSAYICQSVFQLDLSPPFSSVQFSRSIMSDCLRPHESQHARLPCPSPTPGIYPNSCPSSRWCHPAISSSVVPFSSCPQSLPASESFPMSQLFAWGGQSIGVSASASVLPMNIQDWYPFG